jgi:hypothetical protein
MGRVKILAWRGRREISPPKSPEDAAKKILEQLQEEGKQTLNLDERPSRVEVARYYPATGDDCSLTLWVWSEDMHRGEFTIETGAQRNGKESLRDVLRKSIKQGYLISRKEIPYKAYIVDDTIVKYYEGVHHQPVIDLMFYWGLSETVQQLPKRNSTC